MVVKVRRRTICQDITSVPFQDGQSMSEPEIEMPFAAADVARQIVAWRAYLAAERRMSPKTVEAYSRDVNQFLAFQAEHLGGPLTLSALAGLTPQDVRAFMAA